MYNNIFGKCEKCEADLGAADTVGYIDGRHLCSKCRVLESQIGVNDVVMLTNRCEKCDSPLGDYSFSVAGSRLCPLCQASQDVGSSNVFSINDNIAAPTVFSNIGSTIVGLETGMFDVGEISIVDPRDEEIAKLSFKVEELEKSGDEDKEEVNKLKQRLAELEKGLSSSRDKNVVDPSFDKVCKVLEFWIPRNVRRYEESYKSELVEYLAHKFLQVREEARGGLCDILVADKYPIHLKVSPGQSAYDILCGQIYRTLEGFGKVACLIVGIKSADRYYTFTGMIHSNTDSSKVRFFPKAR